MDRQVRDFSGCKVRIVSDDDAIMEAVYQTIIVPYLEDLEYAWLSGTQAEERVKKYLDYAAGLMIRSPQHHGIVDSRKMRRVREMEVIVENIDTPIHTAPAKMKRRKKTETKQQRLEKIRLMKPDAVFSFCVVQTDNRFWHGGRLYEIGNDVAGYQPKRTTQGMLYDMDKVIVVETRRERLFYDQNAFPITRSVFEVREN